ncbi:MAG: hypothetical protein ACOY3Y_04730 [Acidobacteriota bacterium]
MTSRLEADGEVARRSWGSLTLLAGPRTGPAPIVARRMSPGALEAGHQRAYRRFISARSIRKRSLPLPGALERIACNIGWTRMDRLRQG